METRCIFIWHACYVNAQTGVLVVANRLTIIDLLITLKYKQINRWKEKLH